MKHLMGKLLRDSRGGTAIEYGLILGLIVITLMAALIMFAETSVDLWQNISDKVVKA